MKGVLIMPTEHPRVLKNLIKQIKPYIVERELVIPEWKSYTGMHISPNNIVLDGKPAVTMKLGDHWKIGYDETRYFEASVTVPSFLEDKKVYLTIDFGGEAIIRINGEIVGAVSSRNNSGWVHRTEILFDKPLKAGQVLNIQVENAVDSGGFCDTAMAGGTYMEYTLAAAKFSVINEATQSFWYDMNGAFDTFECSEEKYVSERLYICIDKAMHMLDFDFGKEQFYESVPAAQEYFRNAIKDIPSASPGEVILCGHSHLDVAWLWTVKEINRKTARTFSNNLALMKNYPDFKFTQSQAILYDFMKKAYPDIFEQVKDAVKRGQWEITGNAWVEADTNIASGESLIRQLLYGREFFMKEFGVSSDTYWLPDCFGFTWALPQIIKRSGMKYFVTSKLGNNDTNEFPMSIFKWRAHSGDEILAYMQKVGYGGEADAGYAVQTRRSNRQSNVADCSMGMFGYGDGGGGCTFEMVERMQRLSMMPGLPKVTNAHSKDFFKVVEKNTDDLPVWDGEMYYENHRGTYTSQAFIKKNNRRGEFDLRNCEMLGLLSNTYSPEKLEELWKMLLTNQFHDILPGTSIHEAMENTREEYKLLREKITERKTEAFDVLNVQFAKDNTVIVYNFLNWSVTNTVKTEIPFENAVITDMAGEVMKSSVKAENGRFTVEFIAEDVPSMGYKLFRVEEKKSVAEIQVTAQINLLENEYLRVIFDENGLIDEIYDKENKCQILTGKGNVLTVSHDKPIHESAWNLESDYKMRMWKLDKADSIEVVESSAVKGVLRVVRSFNKSRITQDIILKNGARTLDFDTVVDWHEREKVLKAEFPVDVRSRYASYEIAHGAIERPTFANNSYERAMFEVCGHKWADLSEGDYGVSLINDCKYGYDIWGSLMRITLMRGPVCPDPKGDLGINTFRYSLYPHADSWRKAETSHRAYEENVVFDAFYVANGKGTESEKSFIELNKGNIVIDALKKAQDGNGLILRMFETKSQRGEVTVNLPFTDAKVIECNMMECDETPVDFTDGSFTAYIKPHEVKTFRIVV